MNLEEFVETSLRQIIDGVRKAQLSTRITDRHHTESDLVNPRIMYSADSAPKGKHYARQDRNLVHFVSFDVAITADSTIEGKGGMAIRVAGIGFNAGGGASDRDTIMSRIKFDVPVALPQSSDLEQLP